MKEIEVLVLNSETIESAERAMLAAATLTQHSEEITNAEDFQKVYNQPIDLSRIERLAKFPHPALQKLGSVSVIITGLSRRALAQITRHQNEIKFIAGSLQYSDHSGNQRYCFPPGLSEVERQCFQNIYNNASQAYDALVAGGLDRDAAGYLLPQGFRTALLMVATPYQLKHMIRQRACRRNTPEVRYIFLKLYGQLRELYPELFWDGYPACYEDPKNCPEGKMSCKHPMKDVWDEIKELENEDQA